MQAKYGHFHVFRAIFDPVVYDTEDFVIFSESEVKSLNSWSYFQFTAVSVFFDLVFTI